MLLPGHSQPVLPISHPSTQFKCLRLYTLGHQSPSICFSLFLRDTSEGKPSKGSCLFKWQIKALKVAHENAARKQLVCPQHWTMFSNISVYFTDWLDVTFEELVCWYIFVPVKILYLIMIKLQWGTVNFHNIYPIIIYIVKWWYQVLVKKKYNYDKHDSIQHNSKNGFESIIYCTVLSNLWCTRWWFLHNFNWHA